MVDGGPWDKATVNDTLWLKAPPSNDTYATLLKTVWVTVPDPAPILKISEGIWGMKDFSCLGFIGSVSKTVVIFGATYTDCVSSDIGKLVKDDGVAASVLANYDNEHKTWILAGSTTITSGSAVTIDNGTGAGTSSGESSTYGGGAIQMGHGLTGPSDPLKITLMDSSSGFDILHIKKFDGSPGNLDLGNLTAHGAVSVDGTINSGNNYVLYFEGYKGAGADAFIGQNARYNSGYETGSGGNALLLKWATTHSLFGSRGIIFSYNDGISFYADNTVSTAGSSFAPTVRFQILNNGVVKTPHVTLDTSGNVSIDGQFYSNTVHGFHQKYTGNDYTAINFRDGSGSTLYASIGYDTANGLFLNQQLWVGYGGANHTLATGDFTVWGNTNLQGAQLAGQLTFNLASAYYAYLIWTNNYVLQLGANAGPFWYGTSHGRTGYFGGLDVGAVFTDYLMMLDSSNGILTGGYISFASAPNSQGMSGLYIKSYQACHDSSGNFGGSNGGVAMDDFGNFAFIGASSGNYWCVKNGSTNLFAVMANTSGCSFSNLLGGGPVSASSNGILHLSSSSMQYKENIIPIADASWIYNLNPVNFTWAQSYIYRDDSLQIGLIAEDVAKLYEPLVFRNVKGDVEGVYYEKLAVPMLVELQKLKRRVDELEAQLTKIQPAS
jgi:hypothetical protein